MKSTEEVNMNANLDRRSSRRMTKDAFVKIHHSKESQERIAEKTEVLLLEYALSELRKELEVTQRELSELLGITQPTLSGLEKVADNMKLSTMSKYVKALGCEMSINISTATGRSFKIDF